MIFWLCWTSGIYLYSVLLISALICFSSTLPSLCLIYCYSFNFSREMNEYIIDFFSLLYTLKIVSFSLSPDLCALYSWQYFHYHLVKTIFYFLLLSGLWPLLDLEDAPRGNVAPNAGFPSSTRSCLHILYWLGPDILHFVQLF